jgi:hypothetical protein
MILKIFSMAFSAVYEERESSLCLGARWAQSPAAKPKGRTQQSELSKMLRLTCMQ